MRYLCATLLLLLSITPVQAFDFERVAGEALIGHIRPGYQQLLEASQDLNAAIASYCSVPAQDSANRVYEGFKQAVEAWSRLEHLRFGPVTEKNRYERFAYWPDAKTLGRRQVLKALRRKDKSVLQLVRLQKKSVALQGLTALETILFSKTHARTFTPKGTTPHRCGYASTIGANLVEMSGRVLAGWADSGNYGRLWLNPGGDNPIYFTAKEVVKELLNAYNYGMEQAREKRLVDPMGIRPGQARPASSPWQRSNLVLPSLIANIEGLQDLYRQSGFRRELEEAYPGRGDSMSSEFAIALSTLRGIDTSIPRLLSEREMVTLLIPAGYPLKSLLVLGSAYIADVAGLSMGFNASDGD